MAQRKNEGPKQGASASSSRPFPPRRPCLPRAVLAAAHGRRAGERCLIDVTRLGRKRFPAGTRRHRRATSGGCGAGGGAAWLWRTGADLQRLAEAVGRRCSCQDSWGELARQRGAEGKGCVRRIVGVFGIREESETGSS